MPFSCGYLPSTIIHKDHLHVIYQNDHCLVNLKLLLKEFNMGYKDIDSFLFWKQERIIWIGHEKNENNDDCIFGRNEFSKDIVFHVLSFLR